jgi:hypothetical protein
MEAASTSETSVNFYQTTRRNIPEDSHLHAPRRENLKFHHLNVRTTKPFNVIFNRWNINLLWAILYVRVMNRMLKT